jgi:signal transduction histidine kinase
MTERLHFSTEMLRRLGEELNPHADQGVLELVRNAYDADATECIVELINAQKPGGTIRVSDNGSGMTADAIRQGWLVLGRSGKSGVRQTRRKRFPIGNKGIGRLAALRLGRTTVLTTRPSEEPAVEYRLCIDWAAFDKASVVDEVPLEIQTLPRAKGAVDGTVVEISKLRDRLAAADVKRLARALILLADPFRDGRGEADPDKFQPSLRSQEYKDLERLVSRGYLDEADYHLRAELNADGRASAVVTAYGGEEVFRGSHQEISSDKGSARYLAPAAVFDLWWFVLKAANFSPRSVTLTEVREWLAEFGGVHLYHRGMRVSPYSDLDWLDMNLRRVRSPELRPSTNTSIGRVAVMDESGRLQPKTDRIGFVEDAVFEDLRRFATDVLEWFADRMLRRREKRRDGRKERAAKKVRRARQSLQQAVEEVPPETKEKVQKAITEYAKAKDQEANTLRLDLQLYRTLGTVGTTTAAFAHQAKAPLAHIASSAGTLEEAIADSDLLELRTLAELAAGIRRNGDSLLAFAKVTLGLLQHEKRRRGLVSVHASVADVVALLQPYIDLRQVEVRQELAAERDGVLASRAALESILTNLLINALKAFEQRPPGNRLIVIRTRNTQDRGRKERYHIQLAVLDNGPGISGLSVDDVWLPGKTTTVEGTGLGLTIVKDVVSELGGRVAAVAAGELGGAEFLVTLPLRGGG